MTDRASTTSADAYRRAARRLRCRYAHQPSRLQKSLQALATSQPPQRPAVPLTVSPHRDGARAFADYLASAAPEGVLRYSQRLQLIHAARRFGISRFEANLLIAAMLERQRLRAEECAGDSSSRVPSLICSVAGFVVVQSAVLTGVWMMLR